MDIQKQVNILFGRKLFQLEFVLFETGRFFKAGFWKFIFNQQISGLRMFSQ